MYNRYLVKDVKKFDKSKYRNATSVAKLFNLSRQVIRKFMIEGIFTTTKCIKVKENYSWYVADWEIMNIIKYKTKRGERIGTGGIYEDAKYLSKLYRAKMNIYALRDEEKNTKENF